MTNLSNPTVTVSSAFSDEQAAWDAALRLERLGVDASRVTVSRVSADSRVSAEPGVAGDLSTGDLSTGAVVMPRLGKRAISAAFAAGIVAAVVGAVVVAAIGGAVVLGAAFGAGIGVLAGGFWGIATRLPVNADVLDAADEEAAADEDAAVVEMVVHVEAPVADAVVDLLAGADPIRPPTIER